MSIYNSTDLGIALKLNHSAEPTIFEDQRQIPLFSPNHRVLRKHKTVSDRSQMQR
jgi:hypothetical protein